MRRKRVVIHKQVYRNGAWGMKINTTLCGRMRIACDGMNVGDKVTCKFCLRRMAHQAKSLRPPQG